MAIGVYFRFEDSNVGQYDEACRQLNGGELMRSLSDWPGGGCLAHAAWQEGTSLGVFDVWESADAFQAFGTRLMPITAEVGLPQTEPMIVALHNFVGA